MQSRGLQWASSAERIYKQLYRHSKSRGRPQGITATPGKLCAQLLPHQLDEPRQRKVVPLLATQLTGPLRTSKAKQNGAQAHGA